MKRPGWIALYALAVVALSTVVVLGSVMMSRPEPGISPRVQQMIEAIRNATPEPCISFTTRGFVPR
jgi:hypothetical protein